MSWIWCGDFDDSSWGTGVGAFGTRGARGLSIRWRTNFVPMVLQFIWLTMPIHRSFSLGCHGSSGPVAHVGLLRNPRC